MTSIQSQHFKPQANAALKNVELQRALSKAKGGFIDKRLLALSQLPEFDTLRDQAKALKEHTLAHLDFYLEQFEEKVQARGGHVHWAENADQACDIIVRLCQQVNAHFITKGKSMIGEEISLNQALENAGMQVIETDLGEYIIQLAKEPPSHIIAPAVHKTREQISELFYQHHQKEGFNEPAIEIADLVNQARQVLRQHYLKADVGITGANFLIAETGSTIIVTNEGNGDLTQCLPKVHIVISSIEKVVPTLNDASLLMRLLARSATGQHITTYTTLSTGIKADSECSGAEQFHVVLLDNGRSTMLGNEFKEMLRCIRCGACMNHCPVYGAIGGHAYGWVYPGPMGSVLTPLMIGLKKAGDLPQACTMNGRCETVCPMRIPLSQLLRHHRTAQFAQSLTSRRTRWGLAVWRWFVQHPRWYRWASGVGIGLLHRLGRGRGSFRHLPLASAWTKYRDFPAPQGDTFFKQWQQKQQDKAHHD
jgi:L-lactate dehydrogenase complex protein LldF